MSLSTLEDFLNLHYNIIIHRNAGSYILHLPELHLFFQDEKLEIAHEKLELAKRKVLENYFITGNSSKIPLPTQHAEGQNLKKSLTPFFIKLGAFALIAVLLISATNISLSYSLQQAPKAIAQKAVRAVFNNFGSTLEKVVKSELTPEKEEKIRLGIRKLVGALKPYMNEFEPLYRIKSTQ